MHVKARQENGISGYRDIALRTRTRGGRKVTEVLVVNNDYNVTDAYLRK